MTFAELERWAWPEVEEAQRNLPDDLAELARKVPVALCATTDQATALELGADLLGLFEGESFAEEGATTGSAPGRISLFLEPLWEYSGHDPEQFREEVRVTYLHEFGHYLGWDEDELEARGLF